MDFLDNLVLPQSAHHMVLLKYLLVITNIIFIPYFSLLFGSIFYSVYYNRKFIKSGDENFRLFAKDLIDLITTNKVMSVGLGVVPILSSIFCYAQLLHGANTDLIGYLSITLIFFVVGIILVYTYKSSFHLSFLLKYIDGSKIDHDAKNDVVSYQRKTEKTFHKSGIYGLISLVFSGYVFIGTVKFAADSSRWSESSSILQILFSWGTFFGYLTFLIMAFAATFAVILFYYFRQNSEASRHNDEFEKFVKNASLKNGFFFTLLLPLLLTINLVTVPAVALNDGVFALTVLLIFVLLILANVFYFINKNSNMKLSTSLVFLYVVLFLIVAVKDQLAFDTSAQKQFLRLSNEFEVYQSKVKEELGLSVAAISGEDIFNGRCIACHKFDQNLVGPAYNSVLQKYEGKTDQLIRFILNPVKVNPEYPPMPNQGLKPKEAEAVAEYIIKIYNEQTK